MSNTYKLKSVAIIAILLSGTSINVNAQLSPLSIGTIHPGDSIVIVYDVTINNPLVPPTTTQISNQGTVSGSNFSNVLTDDPDTGPANDPTITLLNQFPLPVTLTEFRASQSGSSIILNWKVHTEFNADKYEIERSSDGITFTKIGEVAARNTSGTLLYNFTDGQPFNGNNFYRLRMVDIDGSAKYSGIVKVKIGGNVRAITVFPNPVTASSLNLQLQNMQSGLYTLRLYNTYGQIVMTKLLNHTGGSATETLYLPVSLSKGLYQLQVINAGEKRSFKLLVQ